MHLSTFYVIPREAPSEHFLCHSEGRCIRALSSVYDHYVTIRQIKSSLCYNQAGKVTVTIMLQSDR